MKEDKFGPTDLKIRINMDKNLKKIIKNALTDLIKNRDLEIYDLDFVIEKILSLLLTQSLSVGEKTQKEKTFYEEYYNFWGMECS